MDNPTERFISTKSARARFLFICSRYSFETSYSFCLEAKDLEITSYQSIKMTYLLYKRCDFWSIVIVHQIRFIILLSNLKTQTLNLVLSTTSLKLLYNFDNDYSGQEVLGINESI